MKVLLKRMWFAPEGRRFRLSIPKDNPVEIPDHLRPYLPKDAVVVGDDHEPESEPVSPQTLSEGAAAFGADPDRAAAEALGKIEEEADAEKQRRAEKAEAEKQHQAEQFRADEQLEEEAEAEKQRRAEQFQADLDAENDTPIKRGPGRPRKTSKEG